MTAIVYAIIALILIVGCPITPLIWLIIDPGYIVAIWLAIDIFLTVIIGIILRGLECMDEYADWMN